MSASLSSCPLSHSAHAYEPEQGITVCARRLFGFTQASFHDIGLTSLLSKTFISRGRRRRPASAWRAGGRDSGYRGRTFAAVQRTVFLSERKASSAEAAYMCICVSLTCEFACICIVTVCTSTYAYTHTLAHTAPAPSGTKKLAMAVSWRHRCPPPPNFPQSFGLRSP